MRDIAMTAPADAVAFQASEARAEFLKKTYLHLLYAIAAFVGLTGLLLNAPFTEPLIEKMMSGRTSWLIVLGLFMLVSHVANNWALNATSPGKQYAGLMLFVVAEAIVFLPLLAIATRVPAFAEQHILMNAAVLTLGTFTGLTAIVIFTGKDFSFLGGLLKISFLVAAGVIIASLIFGFQLGIVFCGAMVLLAAGSVLHTTSNVLHHYRVGMHVAAALALFAGIALLFWYILRILMSLTSRD